MSTLSPLPAPGVSPLAPSVEESPTAAAASITTPAPSGPTSHSTPSSPPGDAVEGSAAVQASTSVPPSVGAPSQNANTNPVATRIAALLSGSIDALRERRGVYAEIISARETTIAGLEAELQAINSRINSKVGDCERLLSDKQRLIRKIEEKQRLAAVGTGYGILVGIFTFGAGAVAGGAMAAAAGAALVSFRSELSNVERQKNNADSELRSLKALASTHTRVQSDLRGRLGELRAAHADLVANAPIEKAGSKPAETLAALEAGVGHDRKVIANLEAQITVLQAAKSGAREFEGGLDKLIVALKGDVAALEKQVEKANRAILEAAIGVAVAAFGATASLRKAGIPLSQKQALLVGVDLIRGDVQKVFASLVPTLVKEGLIAATGSALVAGSVAALLGGVGTFDGKTAVATAMAAATGALSDAQKTILADLASEKAYDVGPIAKAVVESPSLTDADAAAVAELLGRGPIAPA